MPKSKQANRILRPALTAALLACTSTVNMHAQWSPSPAEGWVPIALDNLLVTQGSALDFSFLVEEGPAGKYGFIKINDDGKLVFEGKPEQPVRLFTASECMEYWPVHTPEEIAEYARQIKLAGYNCFRPHFLDDMLMINTTEDLVFNPVELDRWDRLSAELKKLGIYLYLDVTTSSDSFYAMPRQGVKRGTDFKRRTYWDPAAREHWEKAMRTLLEHVNPYTGVALKDEPQVILFQLRNEAGLHTQFFERGQVPDDNFLPKFVQWLQNKYSTIKALNTAWGTEISDFNSIQFPRQIGVTASAADLQRFVVDLEIETYNHLKEAIEKVGIRAPILDYNVSVGMALNLTRSAMPIVDTHAYHDHPTAWVSPGSSQPNRSSISRGLDYFVWLNESRMLDRPFVVSEWGFPYWNQWRYEAGVGAPAYAALQDWQLLTHHAEPIRLKTAGGLHPFKIAYDPPSRMADRMAAFFYARGDVASSNNTVEIKLDPEGIFERIGGEGYFSPALRKIPLLSKSGNTITNFSDALVGAPVNANMTIVIHPQKREFAFADALNSGAPTDASIVKAMRSRGILSAANRTDPAQGIYESDTGELMLKMHSNVITVDTPRSKAAALPQGSNPVELNGMRIVNNGESGAFFAGALDGQELSNSDHILIMAVGDAINTDDVYEDESRRVLQKIGRLPVLVKPLAFELHIKRTDNRPSSAYTLWALSFNGERTIRLPITTDADGTLILRISPMEEPALHFELVAKESE